MIGMSINLSTEVFPGGTFLLRERKSGHILCELANTGAGDAILFQIARQLQHRISDMEGSVSKTAFAGWFRARRRNYHSEIRRKLASM